MVWRLGREGPRRRRFRGNVPVMPLFNLPPVPGHKPAAPRQAADGTEATAAKASTAKATTHRAAGTRSTGKAEDPRMTPYLESARAVSHISKVGFSDVLARAAQESNFNASLKSRSSSASGPFQFIEQTWLDMLRRHGQAYGLGPEVAQIKFRNGRNTVSDPALKRKLLDLRHDIPLSAAMAGRYLDECGKDLNRMLRRQPSENERRMAYVLGPGGAAKLIRAAQNDPSGSAHDTLPQAAAANGPLFTGSGGTLSNAEAVQRITRFVGTHLRDFADLAKAQPPVVADRIVEETPVA